MWITLLSAGLGIGLGAALFFFPRAVVRSQALRLADGHGVLAVQEAERRRVARELHDGLGQNLAALRLQLDLARRASKPQLRLDESVKICDETVRELRSVLDDLRPPELLQRSLSELLMAQVERFELRSGLACSLRVEGEGGTSEAQRLCALRVTQEALTNVLRHSGASEVSLRLRLSPEGVNLVIEDEGAGFDPERVLGGHGLRSMRERASFLGGTLLILNEPDQGVRLELSLPPDGEELL